MSDASGAECDLSSLGEGEQIVIWTLRRMVAGRGECPAVIRALDRAFGERAGDLWAGLHLAVRLWVGAGRRTPRLGVPGCGAPTADERRLLLLVALAQARDRARLEAHLLWLVRPEARGGLTLAAAAVADVLAARGYRLPCRHPAPMAARPEPGARRLTCVR